MLKWLLMEKTVKMINGCEKFRVMILVLTVLKILVLLPEV